MTAGKRASIYTIHTNIGAWVQPIVCCIKLKSVKVMNLTKWQRDLITRFRDIGECNGNPVTSSWY